VEGAGTKVRIEDSKVLASGGYGVYAGTGARLELEGTTPGKCMVQGSALDGAGIVVHQVGGTTLDAVHFEGNKGQGLLLTDDASGATLIQGGWGTASGFGSPARGACSLSE
jgi:hypothetical protein